ncbi:MAG: TonB-dependent receptor [Asticcacaulis sp.]
MPFAASADAQTTTAQPTAPAATPATPATPATTDTTQSTTTDKGTTTVTVTGQKQQNRIDRQVYDTSKNIDKDTGTAADALNKVPSVNVDSSGNVTLRGNSNVQVYVNGKPSAMMSGDNRAAALQAMSSSDIQSIEVMNNPGAQYSSEGTGGIINLVMNRNRRPGGFGVATINAGSSGRYGGGFTGSYNSGKFSFTGGFNVRHDSRRVRLGSTLSRLDSNGNAISTTNSNTFTNGKGDNISLNGGVDYNAGDKDTIGAQLNYSNRKQGGNTFSNYSVYDATGAATSVYTRNGLTEGPHEDAALDLHWDHMGKLPGETLKTDLRLSRSDGKNDSSGTDTFTLPAAMAPTSDLRQSSNNLKNGVFSVDYERPVGQDLLSTGIQITYDDNTVSNRSSGSGPLNSTLTSDFAYTQTVSAAYITYQKFISEKWTLLGGARLESLDLKTDQLTSHTTGHVNYSKISPSFFATYVVSPTAKIRFSYSHRLQRPAPLDLNPYVTYSDPLNVTAGNPNLKPQEADKFELGYEVTKPGFNYQARAFYLKNNNVITTYSFFLTPGVLETTKQNYGTNQSGGLEFVASGSLTPKLKINTDATMTYQELTTPGIGGRQSATTPSGRVMFIYQQSPKDSATFMVFSSGKQLTGQGYRSAFSMANISYKHQITPKAAFTVTVNDPFRMAKTVSVTDTPTVRGTNVFSLEAPTLYFGLSYTLGGPSASQLQQSQRGMWGGPGGGGPRGGPGGGGGPGGF